MTDPLPRLLFLVSQLKHHTPTIPRDVLRYIPQPELLHAAREGLQAAALYLGVGLGQLRSLTKTGATVGEEVSPYSFKLAITQTVMWNEDFAELPLGPRLKIMGILERWVNKSTDEMFTYQEAKLGEVTEPEPFEKFNSGFEPVDTVTGGLYQALMVIMGNPGTGKTSHMLSMAESLKRMDPTTRIHFCEIEIPLRMMLTRMGPIFSRGNPFSDDDSLNCGPMSMSDIIRKATDSADSHGDDNQVIIIDSPDAMSSPESGDRRFELETIYRQAIQLKNVSRLVIVASQPKRNDGRTLRQTDLAESWAKAWYADIILGISSVGRMLKMKTLKNRFGLPGGEIMYFYRYEDFLVEPGTIVPPDGEGEDW